MLIPADCDCSHHESFLDNNTLCIVTEYAERGDLNGALAARKGVVR